MNENEFGGTKILKKPNPNAQMMQQGPPPQQQMMMQQGPPPQQMMPQQAPPPQQMMPQQMMPQMSQPQGPGPMEAMSMMGSFMQAAGGIMNQQQQQMQHMQAMQMVRAGGLAL